MKVSVLFLSLLLAAPCVSAAIPDLAKLCPAEKSPLKMISKSGVRKALTPATTSIISAQPDGELMTEVTWSSRTCSPVNGQLTWAEVSGFVPTIVTSGSDMYIYAPLTSLSEIASAWIKGTISEDGSTVTFPTPQAYMMNQGTGGTMSMLYATRVSATDGKPVSGSMDLVFSYQDGNLIQSDGGLLAITDIDGNFYGYGDMEIKIQKISELPVTLPDDANGGTYIMEYKKSTKEFRQSAVIAVSGDDIYFSDPIGIEDSWFRGTKTDAGIVVSTPQYLGSGSGYPLFVVTGSEFTRTETDNITGMQTEVTDYKVTPGEDIIFTYDETTGTYSTTQLLLINSDKDKRGAAYSGFMSPTYTPWTPTPVVPATPSIEYYIDLKDYESFGLKGCMISCMIPAEGENGEFIPQENIYYQISIDDVPFEIYNTTFIPYYGQVQDAANGTVITVNGDNHVLQILPKPENSLGVQSFYDIGGRLISSEKKTYRIINGQLEGESVGTVVEESPVAIRFYNIAGMVVAPETPGIIIRQDIFSDGSIKNTKICNPYRK